MPLKNLIGAAPTLAGFDNQKGDMSVRLLNTIHVSLKCEEDNKNRSVVCLTNIDLNWNSFRDTMYWYRGLYRILLSVSGTNTIGGKNDENTLKIWPKERLHWGRTMGVLEHALLSARSKKERESHYVTMDILSNTSIQTQVLIPNEKYSMS